jgi:hypothetical protein
MSLLDRLEAEWPLIKTAPFTHWILVLLLLGAAVGFAFLWYRRQLDEKNATIQLLETRVDGLKTEIGNLTTALEKAHQTNVPSTLYPVMYGNNAIQHAYAVTTGTPVIPLTITKARSEWSKEDIKIYAAAVRLEEAGLATVDIEPTVTTVASTSTGMLLRSVFDEGKDRKD